MEACVICGGGLPEVSLSTRDPFCSTACAREHYGTGTRAERERARQRRMEQHLEDGTDPASLELIRVTVTERQRLIAEGALRGRVHHRLPGPSHRAQGTRHDVDSDVVLAQGERAEDATLGRRGALVRGDRERRRLSKTFRPQP